MAKRTCQKQVFGQNSNACLGSQMLFLFNVFSIVVRGSKKTSVLSYIIINVQKQTCGKDKTFYFLYHLNSFVLNLKLDIKWHISLSSFFGIVVLSSFNWHSNGKFVESQVLPLDADAALLPLKVRLQRANKLIEKSLEGLPCPCPLSQHGSSDGK